MAERGPAGTRQVIIMQEVSRIGKGVEMVDSWFTGATECGSLLGSKDRHTLTDTTLN
jgi:hypothetical protein